MCGIVGYVGKQVAVPFLLSGLSSLEYRGYDSAGIAIADTETVRVFKQVGHVHALASILETQPTQQAHLGIGHTRWATHGIPSEQNAHPHTDCAQQIVVVHNGIIENEKELHQFLEERGHVFVSQTDTEVIPHLIEELRKTTDSFEDALMQAVQLLKGAFALAVFSQESPGVLYAIRQASPLVIGLGEGEFYLASDPSALVEKTRQVIYLNDGEVARLTADQYELFSLDRVPCHPQVVHLEWDLEEARKGSFPHFMLKEIYEGPEVIRATMRGRVNFEQRTIKLGGLESVKQQLAHTRRVLLLGCGTSYYAGLVAEYFFEELAHISTEVQIASEFRYREQPFEPGTIAIAISQSGETADTLAALQKAKEAGCLTLGVVNVVGSTIARETEAGVYNHAGPEIGVASTKAFLSQLVVLLLIALFIKQQRGETLDRELLQELECLPEKMVSVFDQVTEIEELAAKFDQVQDFLFLGRRTMFPVALEGALKLKEISYVHAEGYGAGEMKHGPLAMISESFPTFALVPSNQVADKMLSNLKEIQARKGPVLAIATQGDVRLARVADEVVFIPATQEYLEPFLAVIPLQLFAYFMGVHKGFDVDKPRNLAKSVTVE